MAVSLPSIHEMFPEHLLRLPPHMRHPPPTLIISQARPPPSIEEPQFSFNVLRSEPASVSLEHVASSVYPPYQLQPPRRQDYKSLSSSEDDDERGDGKHICQTCHKSFNRPSSLRIHVNTHTGATPFRCPFPGCGREFNVNSNMRRHYRNHTNNNTASFATARSLSPQHPYHHYQKRPLNKLEYAWHPPPSFSMSSDSDEEDEPKHRLRPAWWVQRSSVYDGTGFGRRRLSDACSTREQQHAVDLSTRYIRGP
ncbi:hypothetical protein IW261DRAFT_1517107 [Armillaria novae-zelandiae]|uniref:C2H2-type domain-containing protein n=1 Tax=Armillaria novae-zelandiae TaxID=153914 RepID=A0AA39NND2_9AGAR|nr:hypothetical protein IW261DRAFT_1517107 [Armillaria novae-zelandiae]